MGFTSEAIASRLAAITMIEMNLVIERRDSRGDRSSRCRRISSSAMNFDIANACLGFVNGMMLAATMIDAGQIDYALIVDGEAVQVDGTIRLDGRD